MLNEQNLNALISKYKAIHNGHKMRVTDERNKKNKAENAGDFWKQRAALDAIIKFQALADQTKEILTDLKNMKALP